MPEIRKLEDFDVSSPYEAILSIAHSIKPDCSLIEEKFLTRSICRQLTVMHSIPSKFRTVTVIQKYMFLAREAGLIDCIPRTIRYFGAYSPLVADIITYSEKAGLIKKTESARTVRRGKEGIRRINIETDTFELDDNVLMEIVEYLDFDTEFRSLENEMNRLCQTYRFNTDTLGSISKRRTFNAFLNPGDYIYVDNSPLRLIKDGTIIAQLRRPLPLGMTDLPTELMANASLANYIISRVVKI